METKNIETTRVCQGICHLGTYLWIWWTSTGMKSNHAAGAAEDRASIRRICGLMNQDRCCYSSILNFRGLLALNSRAPSIYRSFGNSYVSKIYRNLRKKERKSAHRGVDFVRRAVRRQQRRSGTDTNGAADQMCVRRWTEWPVQQWNMSKWQFLVENQHGKHGPAPERLISWGSEGRFSLSLPHKQHEP